eukprot:COSAG01_NODE_1495_length_10123_cov_6.359537_7_plen_121_part_00
MKVRLRQVVHQDENAEAREPLPHQLRAFSLRELGRPPIEVRVHRVGGRRRELPAAQPRLVGGPAVPPRKEIIEAMHQHVEVKATVNSGEEAALHPSGPWYPQYPLFAQAPSQGASYQLRG